MNNLIARSSTFLTAEPTTKEKFSYSRKLDEAAREV